MLLRRYKPLASSIEPPERPSSLVAMQARTPPVHSRTWTASLTLLDAAQMVLHPRRSTQCSLSDDEGKIHESRALAANRLNSGLLHHQNQVTTSLLAVKPGSRDPGRDCDRRHGHRTPNGILKTALPRKDRDINKTSMRSNSTLPKSQKRAQTYLVLCRSAFRFCDSSQRRTEAILV